MKLKLTFLIFIILFKYYLTNNANGAITDTSFLDFKIELNDSYSKSKQELLKEELFLAAAEKKIKAYTNDSLISYYESVVERYSVVRMIYAQTEINDFESDPNTLGDSIIPLFTLKDINTYSICFKAYFDQLSDNYKFVFTGFSLQYNLIINLKIYGSQPFFFISKEDLIMVLGKEEAIELFLNCYKSMTKRIKIDKKNTWNDVNKLNVDLSKYFGVFTQNMLNERMYDAVTKGLPGSGKHIHAYKTEELKTFYTVEEAFNRGYIIKSKQIEDSNEPPISNDPLIKIHFDIVNNRLYSLSWKWRYDPEKTIATPYISAFGLYVQLENVNRKRYFGILFWIDWMDTKEIFTSYELSVLKFAFFNALINNLKYHTN